jgi:hypothetical protein
VTDTETFHTRLSAILESQAALTQQCMGIIERLTERVIAHESRIGQIQGQCRCMNCKAFEPTTYPPDGLEPTSPGSAIIPRVK